MRPRRRDLTRSVGAGAPDCSIELLPQENTLIVRVTGSIGSNNAIAAGDAICRLIGPDRRPLMVLDLDGLVVADESGREALRAVVDRTSADHRRVLWMPDDVFGPPVDPNTDEATDLTTDLTTHPRPLAETT